MSKGFSSLVAVCLLALSGCTSGMYTSKVYVDKEDNGVSDYAVVSSLDVKEYTQSMPVVMESSYKTEKYENDLNILLFAITFGIVPGFTTETRTYDVTVKTPIGEKSGKGYVKASKWMGWIPLFLPYPGIADERSDCAQLPHAGLEKKVQDKLVANLVSQFPKEAYDSFVEEWKKKEPERKRLEAERAEVERIRLEKEEVERKQLEAERAEKMRLTMRTEIYEKTVEYCLAMIKESYLKGERIENPWRECGAKSDWLANWASPRLDLTEANALSGEALLSEFGAKYLPNAYANYEKKRDALLELQQVFNEEFPEPWTIKNTSPKWNSFNKVLEKFVRARTEFIICHDELCHYWLMSRFGVLIEKDFAQIDAQRLAVHLLPIIDEGTGYTLLEINPMDGKISDFAAKYAPESNTIYQKMEREFKELDALLSEVFKQRIQMDDVRYSRALAAAVAKRNDLVREMNSLSQQLEAWYMDHKIIDKSSEDVAKCDVAMGKQLKPFLDALPLYIKERSLGPVIANSELIAIPGRHYRMQRTEVTQFQWMAVMGYNPSKFWEANRPVENVSWDDCQEFVKRASQMDGRRYRLPTEEEWKYACRANSEGNWGRRVNGECGPLDTMGWYHDNSGGRTHAIAQKEPNAWGLYDMHGNVWEWCQDLSSSGAPFRVIRGGSLNCEAGSCAASSRDHCAAFARKYDLGFRLVYPQD